MDNFWIGQALSGKSTLNVRYMSKIPDCAKSEEVSILCPFWDPTRACGVQIGIDGIAREDHGDNQLGGAKGCETNVCNLGAYWIL